MRLLFILILLPNLLFSQKKLEGFFNDDNLKDYIEIKKIKGIDYYTIFLNSSKGYLKSKSFNKNDFSDESDENFDPELVIYQEENQEICVEVICCGTMKSKEISYFKYVSTVDNWLLYKISNIEMEDDRLPLIDIKCLPLNSTIDNKLIKEKNLFKGKYKYLCHRNDYVVDKDYKIDYKILNLNCNDIQEIINNIPISNANVNKYNDLAFYISKKKDGSFNSSYLLKKIIEKFPNRVVAYLNLADSYYDIEDINRAKTNYKKYISLMTTQGKDLKKIPQRVYDRTK